LLSIYIFKTRQSTLYIQLATQRVQKEGEGIMELGGSIESTPTWAVAVVATGVILISLGIEHVLHLLAHVCLHYIVFCAFASPIINSWLIEMWYYCVYQFFKKRKRRTLMQALEDVKAGEYLTFSNHALIS